MALTLSVANAKTPRSSVLNTAIGANATIKIYDGSQPVSPDVAVSSQMLLVSFTGNSSAFGDVANGVLTIRNPVQAIASNTSTATWARIASSTGNAIVDMDVANSNATMTLSHTNITIGDPVTITGTNTFTEV